LTVKKYSKFEPKKKTMFDPPITSGANLFIFIALGLIAAVAAIIAVDVYKTTFLKKEDSEED
jgi:hypothetical protein